MRVHWLDRQSTWACSSTVSLSFVECTGNSNKNFRIRLQIVVRRDNNSVDALWWIHLCWKEDSCWSTLSYGNIVEWQKRCAHRRNSTFFLRSYLGYSLHYLILNIRSGLLWCCFSHFLDFSNLKSHTILRLKQYPRVQPNTIYWNFKRKELKNRIEKRDAFYVDYVTHKTVDCSMETKKWTTKNSSHNSPIDNGYCWYF